MQILIMKPQSITSGEPSCSANSRAQVLLRQQTIEFIFWFFLLPLFSTGSKACALTSLRSAWLFALFSRVPFLNVREFPVQLVFPSFKAWGLFTSTLSLARILGEWPGTYLVVSHLLWVEGGSILVVGFVIWTKGLSMCLSNCQAILNLAGQLNSTRKSCRIRFSNWEKIGLQEKTIGWNSVGLRGHGILRLQLAVWRCRTGTGPQIQEGAVPHRRVLEPKQPSRRSHSPVL